MRSLAPGLITPEVFERAFGLLADLYQDVTFRALWRLFLGAMWHL
jgi:hypothetical protein